MTSTTELRELLSKATPGPWVARKSMSNDCSIVTQSQPGEPLTCFSVGRMADAALIVAAVNALPGLLDERDRLAGEVERLKGLRDDALGRVEDLEREAETVSAEFEKDCWIAVRSLLTEVGFKDFSDGITAQDACDIIRESIEGADKRAETAESLSASLAEMVKAGWLPIALCPTDGEWRASLLPDGSEVVAAFEGGDLGPRARRWRVKSFAYHNPSRPTGEMHGGVEQFTKAHDTFVVQDLPEGVYPTHFRPNDTVYGAARALLQPKGQ